MIPFHFGPPERPLFGLFHSAGGPARGDRAVLLCNPFGQEAVRSHRVFRVLAERLSRDGLPVLRFDYHATGDSPGDDEAGDLIGWAGDVRVAMRELVARSGARRVVCVGARLGAALAVRAASSLAETTRLVLWDPIVAGDDYLALLRVKHVEALESTYSLADKRWREQLANDPSAFTDEAIGFGMSPALRQQIRQLGPHSLPLPPGIDVHVLAHPSDAATSGWVASLPARGIAGHHWPLEDSFEWTVGERRNSALVPPAALNRLLSCIRD